MVVGVENKIFRFLLIFTCVYLELIMLSNSFCLMYNCLKGVGFYTSRTDPNHQTTLSNVLINPSTNKSFNQSRIYRL